MVSSIPLRMYSPSLIFVNGSGIFGSSLMKDGPAKMNTNRQRDQKIACPPMCFTIFLEMMYSLFLQGGLWSNSGVGSSVARAREAKESMIMFTQRSQTGLRGGSFKTTAATNEVISATTFTVSQNCKNLLILSQTFLPHMQALTIEAKLSS